MIKKNINTNIIFFIPIFLLLIIFLVRSIFVPWLVMSGAKSFSYDKNIFIDNEEAYKSIAELIYSDYCQDDTDQRYCYVFAFSEGGVRCLTTDKILILDNVNLEYAERIQSTYQLGKYKRSLDRIYAMNGFLSFGNEEGRTSFIYSRNNAKPKFVNAADDNYGSVYIEKLTDCWYYASK